MYSRNTEIRHISSNDVYKLAQILEQTNSWKKVMGAIPKCLSTDWETIPDGCPKKYSNDDIRLIEIASVKKNRMGMEILFEEWGTSGRKRPTVANLLDLLVKVELFRAADYVAEHFLNEPLPNRPTTGPAAKIDISLPFVTEEIRQVEEMLDAVSYPGTTNLIQNANQSSNINNKDFYSKLSPDRQKVEVTASDLMKFSVSVSDYSESSEIPMLSALGPRQISSHSSSENENNDTLVHDISENDIPDLSALEMHHNSMDLPNLSALNLDTTAESNGIAKNLLHASSTNFDDSSITPDLSILDQSSLDDSSLTNVTETSADLSFDRRTRFHSSENNIPMLSIFQK